MKRFVLGGIALLTLPHLAWRERIGSWWETGRREPILDQMLLSNLARYLVSRGYAFVAADMRGTRASFGRHVMDRQIEVNLDLLPTAWTFQEGHRVRLSVTGADAGNFELNLVLCPEGTVGSCDPAELYVHQGEAMGSHLELPVLLSGQRRGSIRR